MSEQQVQKVDVLFPIRELSTRTGVNSVTLRAWERRYGLLKPFRTEKGHRLYGDKDVERVERILYWMNQGVAVGKVRALLDRQGDSLETETLGSEDLGNQWRSWQDTFVEAARSFSQRCWEQLFQEAVKQYPFHVLLVNGILPTLQSLNNDMALKRYVMTSLAEQITLLKLNGAKSIRSSKEKVLIVNMDECNLMAKLVAWWVIESGRGFALVDGVTHRQEAESLQAGMGACQIIIVAERTSEQGVKRWLEEGDIGKEMVWVSSGAWLYAEHQGLATDGWAFSNVAELIQSELNS